MLSNKGKLLWKQEVDQLFGCEDSKQNLKQNYFKIWVRQNKIIMDPLTAALAEIETNGDLENKNSVKSGMSSVYSMIVFFNEI